MALRLRRGTNADRLTVTPAEGELLYTTDSKKIYAGDGSTTGGNIVSGINNLLEDLTPQLGGDLDLNSKNIVGNGDISITGSIDAGAITADVYGSVFGNDSEPLVDVINSKIILTNNSINDLNDVSSGGATIGQVLKWSGTSWTPQNDTDTIFDLSGQTLNNLGDVNVAGVQLDQVLTWGGSEWTASNVQLSMLADVDLSSVTNGDTLVFNGSYWSTGQSINDLSNLTDTVISNPLDNQLLRYDNTFSKWVNFSLTLTDISNVSAVSPFDNQFIKYNLASNTWITETLTMSSLADIDLTVLKAGDILAWNGYFWVPEGGIGEIRDTDIQGSVYGNDSSIIVDSLTNTINAEGITASSNEFNLASSGDATSVFNFTHNIDQNGGRPRLSLLRTSNADLSANYGIAASIQVADVGSNGIIEHNKILFMRQKGFWIVEPDGDFTTNDNMVCIYSPTGEPRERKGRVGIGTWDPTEKLDVRGNVTTTGFVQFGRYTTAERDDLTTTNSPQYATNYGMVIYNTTTNTFQGWANVGGSTPTWVDLS